MIFEKREPQNEQMEQNEQMQPTTRAISGNPLATLKKFYSQNYMDLIRTVGNMLKESKFIIKCDDIYLQSSYIGDCLLFLNNGFGETSSNTKFSLTKTKFFKKILPVRSGFKIELNAQQIVVYAVEAVDKCPTQEFAEIAPSFYEFAKHFMSDEIQSAIVALAEVRKD